MLGKCEVVLKVGNGATVAALAIGTIFVLLPSRHALNLYDFLHVPNVIRNVMSIPKLVQQNYEFTFANNCCYIHYGNEYAGKAIMVNDLYFLETHM